jgi:hypothetical protein
MNRIALAPALIMALLLLATLAAPFPSIVNADVSAEMPALNVLSPLPKIVYHSSDVLLSFEVTRPQSWSEVFPGYSGGILYEAVGIIKFVRYILDGKESENTTVNDDQGGLTIGPSSEVFDFSFNLTGLSDGLHNVTVSVFGSHKGDSVDYSKNVIFFVDAAPLELKIVSPEKKVYNITDIPLTITATETVSWMGYSLDEGDRITISENTTLRGLPAGSHSLTVFANDTIGNFAASETINFTTAQEPEPKPFPTALAAIATAIIITSGVAFLFYFKRNKATKNPRNTEGS